MKRQILGVVAGFVAWSVIWLACNAALAGVGMLPQDAAQPITETSVLLALLVCSVVASLAAGYVTALATPTTNKRRAVATLGWVLITVGVFVQGINLQLMPLWYHFIFVALLLPSAAAGGRLRTLTETSK